MSKKVKITVHKRVSFTRAIRAKCLDCTCNQSNEVKYCTISDCPLFPYRFGVRPESYINRHPDEVIIVK